MIDEETLKKYDLTVGIECHVQLATVTKLFSGADNDERDKSPNSVVSPIDFGLPGMLPVLNRGAVDLAIKAGKALNSPVAHVSRFDRKHYFYPDLPKGYQTTQMYQPIIGPGVINVPLDDGSSVDVRIHHAHMEEDAGKLTHHGSFSLVDLNRAGTPLIEIVSEPDIHSAVTAKAFAIELYNLMTYAGVTRGDLYHGNMRFDVNISAALKGSTELGTRSEVKNLNSFRSVERAVDFEFRRQIEMLEKGEPVVQETRGWDEAKQKTSPQRSKENAQDYRYMPDADIPPVVLTDDEINRIQLDMPKLPPFYRESWKDIGFDPTITNALLSSQDRAMAVQHIFEAMGPSGARYFGSMQLLTDAILEKNIDDKPKYVPSIESQEDLIRMIEENVLSFTAAKDVYFEMYLTGKSPREIATDKNLIQVSDEGEIMTLVNEVLNDISTKQAVDDLKNGNEKVIGFLVGQVMKKSGGKANPSLVQKLIRERIK